MSASGLAVELDVGFEIVSQEGLVSGPVGWSIISKMFFSISIARALLVVKFCAMFRVVRGLRRLLDSILSMRVANDFKAQGSGVVAWIGALSSSRPPNLRFLEVLGK